MRLLLVEPFGQLTGHPSFYTYSLLKGILKSDPENQVSVLSFAGFIEENLFTNIETKSLISKNSLFYKWGISIFGISKFNTYIGTLFICLWLLWNKNKFDKIHFIDAKWLIFYFCFLFTRLNNFTLTVLGSQPTSIGESFISKIRIFIDNLTLKGIHKKKVQLITHTIDVRNWTEKILGQNSQHTHLIPWGINSHENLLEHDKARKILSLGRDSIIFLFFGQIDKRKGILEFVESIQDMQDDIIILVVGKDEGQHSLEIKEMAKKIGWTDKVHINNKHISSSELQTYFRASDAVILNYGKFSNASGVLFNAIEFHVPIVGSNYGQIGKVISENSIGYLFEPHNKSEIKAACLRLIQDKKKCPFKIQENLLKFIKENSWEKIGKEHLKAYANEIA